MNRPLEELFDELTGPARPLGPTDWPEPGQLRRRAEHRRTVRRASIAASVAVVAVVAIAVPATLANRGSGRITPATHDTTNPGGTHKAAPAKSGHPAVTATPTARSTIGAPLAAGAKPPTGGRATFGQVSLVVPDGWTADRTAELSRYDGGRSFSNEACIAPPQTPATRSYDGCSGLEIFYDGFLPAQGAQAYNGNRETSAAWAHGPDVPSCPSTGTTAGAAAVLPLQGPSDWAYQLVGTVKKAVYNDWRVSCSDGTSFHPQAWYLPKEQIVFWSYVSNPTAQAILATAVLG